jgi:hypothetical protein
MKIRMIKYYSLAIVLISVGLGSSIVAQPKISANQAKQLIEKTVLLTDREIYTVDENILFSAFNISSPALRNADWSTILYVELASPDGEIIVRRKFNYNKDGASGALRIPNSVLTGNYYLKAYTRWMRDYSPYNFYYKMVTVINPFRDELLESSSESEMLSDVDPVKLTETGELQLTTDQNEYKKRDTVRLEISANAANEIPAKLVISVIPAGAESSLPVRINKIQELQFSPDYIPETRGLSVSGKIVNAKDSVPMAFTLVGLTIFKDHPENRNVLTNENGQFFFDLSKLEGEYELFISAKSNENQNPLILVDNDFSTQAVKLPYLPVDFSDQSKELYQTISFNSQMHALYKQKETEKKLKSFSSDSAFYGAPDFVLKLADYIALPTIKDYFYELIPQVGVRHEGKKSVLKVLGNYSELAIYEPLVLVDMVPVFDIDKVLALQPERIERIEVVTTPYIRGDIIFGGIVSLFSKKGDLAGIDLPSAGRFINYSMLSGTSGQLENLRKGKNIPDLRNCIYWNPDVRLDKANQAALSFKTGDNTGDFLILVRSINSDERERVTITKIRIR